MVPLGALTLLPLPVTIASLVSGMVGFGLAIYARRRRLPRATLMAACFGLGAVAIALSWAFGVVIPIPADSVKFAQGLAAGVGVGSFLAVIVLFVLDKAAYGHD